MTSSTVKCASCNVVIDEVLAFITNKIDVMDQESLMRICVSAFKLEEVEKSKNLLFDSITTDIRKITRKKKSEGKIQRDLEDIIIVLKSLDPEVIPIFVAKDLHRLPAVLFDHLDCSALLKDITLLRAQVESIKSTYVTTEQLHNLEVKLHSNKYDSIVDTPIHHRYDHFVNTRKRGANLLNSGPMAIVSMAETITSSPLSPPVNDPTPTRSHSERPRLSRVNSVSVTAAQVSSPTPTRSRRSRLSHINSTAAGAATTGAAAHDSTLSPEPALASETLLNGCEKNIVRRDNEANTTEIDTGNNVNNERLPLKHLYERKKNGKDINELSQKITFADIGKTRGLWHVPERDEEWKLVQRKRLRNKFTMSKGKASLEQSSKFKAADTKIPLFITNVHKDVSEADIVEYVLKKTQEKTSPIKLKMARQRSYNAFKIFVSKHNLQTFLDVSLWPKGISFRRFVDLRDKEHGQYAHVGERQPHYVQNG